tara:strand:- start:3765 stop:5570 length:1806 start_codon:yes stop_codon:yes gene_type:complete
MLTPILKAKNSSGKEIAFYNPIDYQNWLNTEEAKKSKWNIRYLKGLGSSGLNEGKEYFKTMKKIAYKYNENSDEAIELAFNKKRADDRKQWLMTYDKNEVIDNMETELTYNDLIHKELKHFSNSDIIRSIPNICDGFKVSIRKIMFVCFKRKITKEIKVAQLGASVSELSSYHHGENSLFQSLINLSQKFVGANNIPLLEDKGNFGTRLLGGDDSGSPRYLFTHLSKLSKLIFKEEDFDIVDYINEEGMMIQPEYYIPTIPFCLINNIVGIGTGFSTNIPSYNPTDIINQCKLLCNNLEKEDIDIKNSDDLLKAFGILNNTQFSKLAPYFLGFKGEIYEKDGKYVSKGVYKVEDNILTITELPVYTWTEDYKSYLEDMLQKNKIKDIINHCTAKNVTFIIKLIPNYNIKDIESDFKLLSSRNLSTNNLHLFNQNGVISKYEDTKHILKDWCSIRLTKYFERKENQLKNLQKQYELISAKAKFIQDVIDGKIKIMNVPQNDVIDKLSSLNYPKISQDNEDTKSYNYLLNMSISSLTKEKKDKLEKEKQKMETEIDRLRKKPIYKIWYEELDELEEEWNKYKEEILEDYKLDQQSYEKTLKKK